MRPFFLGMLALACLIGGSLARAEAPSAVVQQAQERVWDIQDQLADAHYHLASLHLTEDSNRLQTAIQKVDPSRDPQKAYDLQARLTEVERKRSVEQQRLLLTHQLVKAERSGDHATEGSIRSRLKALH